MMGPVGPHPVSNPLSRTISLVELHSDLGLNFQDLHDAGIDADDLPYDLAQVDREAFLERHGTPARSLFTLLQENAATCLATVREKLGVRKIEDKARAMVLFDEQKEILVCELEKMGSENLSKEEAEQFKDNQGHYTRKLAKLEEQIEQELELEVVDSTDGEVTFKVVEVDNEREDISYVHVREEAKVEEAIERMYERSQQDMFNSEDWNWSGLR